MFHTEQIITKRVSIRWQSISVSSPPEDLNSSGKGWLIHLTGSFVKNLTMGTSLQLNVAWIQQTFQIFFSKINRGNSVPSLPPLLCARPSLIPLWLKQNEPEHLCCWQRTRTITKHNTSIHAHFLFSNNYCNEIYSQLHYVCWRTCSPSLHCLFDKERALCCFTSTSVHS